MAFRSKLGVCDACGGFVPARASSCVHCNVSRRPLFERLRVGALGGAFGGGAIAFTLMACYGMPPCDDGTYGCRDDNSDGGTPESDASRDARRPDVQVNDGSLSDASTDDHASLDAGDGGDESDAADAADGN